MADWKDLLQYRFEPSVFDPSLQRGLMRGGNRLMDLLSTLSDDKESTQPGTPGYIDPRTGLPPIPILPTRWNIDKTPQIGAAPEPRVYGEPDPILMQAMGGPVARGVGLPKLIEKLARNINPRSVELIQQGVKKALERFGARSQEKGTTTPVQAAGRGTTRTRLKSREQTLDIPQPAPSAFKPPTSQNPRPTSQFFDRKGQPVQFKTGDSVIERVPVLQGGTPGKHGARYAYFFWQKGMQNPQTFTRKTNAVKAFKLAELGRRTERVIPSKLQGTRGPKLTRQERLQQQKLERLERTPSHFDERGTTLTQEVLNKRFGGPGSPTQRYQGIIHRIGTNYRVYDPVTAGQFTDHASRTLAIQALRRLRNNYGIIRTGNKSAAANRKRVPGLPDTDRYYQGSVTGAKQKRAEDQKAFEADLGDVYGGEVKLEEIKPTVEKTRTGGSSKKDPMSGLSGDYPPPEGWKPDHPGPPVYSRTAKKPTSVKSPKPKVIGYQPSQKSFDRLSPAEQDIFQMALKKVYGENLELKWDDGNWDEGDKLDFWGVGKEAVERARLGRPLTNFERATGVGEPFYEEPLNKATEKELNELMDRITEHRRHWNDLEGEGDFSIDLHEHEDEIRFRPSGDEEIFEWTNEGPTGTLNEDKVREIAEKFDLDPSEVVKYQIDETGWSGLDRFEEWGTKRTDKWHEQRDSKFAEFKKLTESKKNRLEPWSVRSDFQKRTHHGGFYPQRKPDEVLEQRELYAAKRSKGKLSTRTLDDFADIVLDRDDVQIHNLSRKLIDRVRERHPDLYLKIRKAMDQRERGREEIIRWPEDLYIKFSGNARQKEWRFEEIGGEDMLDPYYQKPK